MGKKKKIIIKQQEPRMLSEEEQIALYEEFQNDLKLYDEIVYNHPKYPEYIKLRHQLIDLQKESEEYKIIERKKEEIYDEIFSTFEKAYNEFKKIKH